VEINRDGLIYQISSPGKRRGEGKAGPGSERHRPRASLTVEESKHGKVDEIGGGEDLNIRETYFHLCLLVSAGRIGKRNSRPVCCPEKIRVRGGGKWVWGRRSPRIIKEGKRLDPVRVGQYEVQRKPKAGGGTHRNTNHWFFRRVCFRGETTQMRDELCSEAPREALCHGKRIQGSLTVHVRGAKTPGARGGDIPWGERGFNGKCFR